MSTMNTPLLRRRAASISLFLTVATLVASCGTQSDAVRSSDAHEVTVRAPNEQEGRGLNGTTPEAANARGRTDVVPPAPSAVPSAQNFDVPTNRPRWNPVDDAPPHGFMPGLCWVRSRVSDAYIGEVSMQAGVETDVRGIDDLVQESPELASFLADLKGQGRQSDVAVSARVAPFVDSLLADLETVAAGQAEVVDGQLYSGGHALFDTETYSGINEYVRAAETVCRRF